jgi:predicted acetyltransferase
MEVASNPDLLSFLRPISVGMGREPRQDEADMVAELLNPDRALSARVDDTVVGSAGAYSLRLSVPGGVSVPTAGVGFVGVLPSHRRRGIGSALMTHLLADVRGREEPLAALWPSEERIYGRFGFGIASFGMSVELPTWRAGLRDDPAAVGGVTLVDPAEARPAIAPVYDGVRLMRAGMIERTDAWWRLRRLAASEPPTFVASWADQAYAIYRVHVPWFDIPDGVVEVIEAAATSVKATREIWRYLFSLDLCQRVRAERLPLDHPILHMLAEPRQLHARLADNLWLRLVDVRAALELRHRGPGSVVVEVRDDTLSSNGGVWRVTEDGVRRGGDAELALDVADLAAVYLGAATFAELARAGRVQERAPGAAARGDAVLPAALRPWTPEVF